MPNDTPTTWIATTKIVPGHNDRTIFDFTALVDLAENIRTHGLINPPHVRPLPASGLYEIVAGERRYRACTEILHWPEMPVVVEAVDDETAAGIMLAENTARADLNPMDEANAYASRMSAYSWTVEDCARRAAVTPARVQQRLKLLTLRPDLQDLIRSGQLSIGYALIIAYADLDTNRQHLAACKLRDNPRPTPGWLRTICAELSAQQKQGALFEVLPLLGGTPDQAANHAPEPPTPGTHAAPHVGKNAKARIQHQIGFWQQAADEWQRLGKPFKRQECAAAAQALQGALETL